ncbi:MAG: hypothetical protein EA396_01520 [Anaerolineaceae bacterium]|nr:MAG: hypothetical protein EA396_01520 [Anaerolineaceae bacterium]
MTVIAPTHRLMLMYDINPLHYSSYYRYVLGDFVPTMQKLGLHMIYAWQVVSDHRPERQIDFICEGQDVIYQAIHNERFIRAERRLKSYTQRYQRKIVIFENRFQL